MRIDMQPGGIFTFGVGNPAIKRDPAVAAKRKELAVMWRKMRARDPAIARLMRRRLTEAAAEAVRHAWGL